ncbi:MAG: hypothetical protein AAFX86_07235 [Pseudomonadota bacterium]
MRRYRLSPEAVDELKGVSDWIERESGSAVTAEKVIASIEDEITKLAGSPFELGVSASAEAPGIGLRR